MHRRSSFAVVITMVTMVGLLFAFAGDASAQNKNKNRKKQPAKKQQARKNTPDDSAKIDFQTGSGLGSRSEAIAAAKKIDELLEAHWKKVGVEPQPMVDDEVFLRRAYLDIVGRIPTVAEAKKFLVNRTADKRQDLVDELLLNEGHVSHYFNYWADVLRIKTRLTNQVNGGPYMAYVKDFIRTSKPYDEFVYELITAEGKIWEDGAAGYFLRDTGMPLDNMANTTRVFLGTSIGCAQCHDHPFDKWSQMEFYEMSAFTFGVQTRARGRNAGPNFRQVEKLAREQKVPQQVINEVRSLTRQSSYGVSDDLRRYRLKLPNDYKYDDAKPGQEIQPLTIFGDAAPLDEKGTTPRVAFGKWLTSPTNPRFTLNIANRMWKKVMGMGLIEPIDEIMDDTTPQVPELMDFLVEYLKESDYNLKQFVRTLHYTKAYQLAAFTSDFEADSDYHFHGRILRRMTAEQLWDSVVTIAVPGRPEVGYDPDMEDAYDLPDISGMTPQQVLDVAKKRVANRGNRRGNNMMSMMNRRAGNQRGMVRASDLPSPAPPSHFLQQFGQADREQIESASLDPNQVQVLTMLNGLVDPVLMKASTQLIKDVNEADTLQDKIRTIYLSILARTPNGGEMSYSARAVRSGGADTFGDLVWALLNSREFLFIQ